MKKLFLVIVFFCLFFQNVFSQDRKQTIYFDFYPMFSPGFFDGVFGLGIGYDFHINKYFSIGNYNYFYIPLKSDALYGYNFTLNGKYYPIRSSIGTPFIDLGIGYRRDVSEKNNIHSLTGLVNIGYIFIFKNGLILAPGFGIRYNLITFSGSETMDLGTYIKAIVGWIF